MIDAMKKGLEALQGSGYYDTTQQREAITALRQAIEQAEKPHPDHYAEVYIRVGDLHIKKVLTSIEFMQSHDPIRLLSLRADNALREIKELL